VFGQKKKIDCIEFDTLKCKFLHKNESGDYVFETPTQEKLEVKDNYIYMPVYVKAGMVFLIYLSEEFNKILEVRFPSSGNYKVTSVTELDPRTRSVILENGKRIKCPGSVNVGDYITIKLPEEEFISKATSDQQDDNVNEDEDIDDEDEDDEDDEDDKEKKIKR